MQILEKREDSGRKVMFVATSKEEQLHKKKLQELLLMKRNGDWQSVSELLGISKSNAMASFDRVYSKNHLLVINALETVIEARRKSLIK